MYALPRVDAHDVRRPRLLRAALNGAPVSDTSVPVGSVQVSGAGYVLTMLGATT